MRLLLLGLISFSCFAQLQSVEMEVSGLNCESCSDAVAKRFQRLRGVESAAFDPQRNIASLTFLPDNKVGFDVVRDLLKNLGYTPGDATISVRGTLRKQDGKTLVSLPHQPDAFTVEEPIDSQGSALIKGLVKAGGFVISGASLIDP